MGVNVVTQLTGFTLLSVDQGCGSSNLATEHTTPGEATSEVVERGGFADDVCLQAFVVSGLYQTLHVHPCL